MPASLTRMAQASIWEASRRCGSVLRRGLYGVLTAYISCTECKFPFSLEVEPLSGMRFTVRTKSDPDTDDADQTYYREEAIADQNLAMAKASFRFVVACTNCQGAMAVRICQESIGAYVLRRGGVKPSSVLDVRCRIGQSCTWALDNTTQQRLHLEKFQLEMTWDDNCWDAVVGQGWVNPRQRRQ